MSFVFNAKENKRKILNYYLPEEVQADIALSSPKMDHTKYLQDAWDTYVQPGDIVTLSGNFNLSKNKGYKPEYYGEDGRTVPKGPDLTLNGSQPCLSFSLDNNVINFAGAKFIVKELFNDGLHIRDYKGINSIQNLGSWYTKRILEVDPNATAATDRQVLTRGSLKWLPPIDGNTGFAVKGTKEDGFNTTVYTAELSGYRSNACDTSRISANGGGYMVEGKHAFPQDNGTTAETWGSWGEGFIGNWNAALLITQNPDFTQNERDAAKLTVDAGYIRGWMYAGVEIGSIGNSKGEVPYNLSDDIAKYSPKNITLSNLVIEDCHETGIQRTRFDNLIIENCVIRRMGHPDWTLAHAKSTRPNVTQVDPGYGISSGRMNQQGKLTIRRNVIVDCNRKGIDAHHGTQVVIEDNFIKAGVWGIQVALEDKFVNRKYNEYSHELTTWTIRNNEIHAGIKGIDFANGAFGPKPRLKEDLWFLKCSILIDNNKIYAPYGWYYNYAHSGFTIINNTITFSLPYGKYYAGGNEEMKSAAIYHGSNDTDNRGIAIGDIIANNRIMNSKYGNFYAGISLENTILANVSNNIIDITPYTKRTLQGANEPFISNEEYVYRNTHATIPLSAPNVTNEKFATIFSNNVSYNFKDGSSYQIINKVTGKPYEIDPEKMKPKEDQSVSAPQHRESGDTNINIVNFEDIAQEGKYPPAGFKNIVTNGDPLTISPRLRDISSTAGVYASVRIPKREDSTMDKVKFTASLIATGKYNNSVIFSYMTAANEYVPSISVRFDPATSKFYVRSTEERLVVNNTIIQKGKEVEVPANTPINFELYTRRLNGVEKLYIGAPNHGNNQMSLDMTNLEIHRNVSL